MTSNIDLLREDLELFRSSAARERQSLAKNPDNRAALFFARGFERYAEEAAHNLEVENKARAREFFEVRLNDGPIGHASAPARLFGRFISELADAIESAAWRVNGGAGKRTPKDIGQQLDLRVVGLMPGSTRIAFSGQLQPDLGGPSALEATLHQLFDLMDAQGDGFYSSIESVGVVAARHLANALKPLQEQDASAEFTWPTPSGPVRKWAGTPAEIARLRSRISVIDEPESFEQSLTGEVIALAVRGRVELEDSEGHRHVIRYKADQRPIIARLTLWQKVTLRVNTERALDRAAGRHIERHQLIDRG